MGTPCDCSPSEFPFFCKRHGCKKTKHWYHLCRTRKDYFRLWEEGRGPGQRSTLNTIPRRVERRKRLQLVIARYNEDLSWLRRFHHFPTTVYDKGDGSSGLALPNVGREAHTYLHHIVTHYDRLSDITVFLQGDPFAHVGGLDCKLREISDEVGFRDLCDHVIVEDAYGHPVHPGLPIGEMYSKLFGESFPDFFMCHTAACFAVSKENILARSKAFYEQALQLVLDEPLGPWAIERLWQYVFQGEAHSQGIATASDSNCFRDLQFLLLSLREVNSAPVVIFDLGLTEEQRQWCDRQPDVRCLLPPTAHESVSQIRNYDWWQTWLKPFYIFHAPFDRVLWLDADCIVLGNLTEAFRIVAERPLLVKDGTRARTENDSRLYKHLPLPNGSRVRDLSLNAGVLGLCKIRDRRLLDTWAYGIQWAAGNPSMHPLISWADQGMLHWAVHRTNSAELIREDLAWNYPSFEAPHLIASAIANRRSLLAEIAAQYADAKIVHWFGVYKLSRQIESQISEVFAHLPVLKNSWLRRLRTWLRKPPTRTA